MADRAEVERKIVGALRSAIDAHGPITKDQIGSAAKRVYGALYGDPCIQQRLDELGIAVDDEVRFRQRPGGRFLTGRVRGVAKDGSVELHDAKGRMRSVSAERLEMKTTGPRGGVNWLPLPRKEESA